MKNTHQLKLFLVSHPIPFDRYEDHEAALYLQLHELIEEAQQAKEDPVALIESYLGVACQAGTHADELTAFLFQTGEMMAALHALKENWHHLDDSVPAESVMYGGVSKAEATQVYSEISLRTYLEALISFSNDHE